MSELAQTQVDETSQIEAAVSTEQPKTPKSPEEQAKIEEAREAQRARVEAALLGYTPEQAREAFRNKTHLNLAGTIALTASDQRKLYANLIKVTGDKAEKAPLIAVPIAGGTKGAGYMVIPNPKSNPDDPKTKVALAKAGYNSSDIGQQKPAIVGIADNGNVLVQERAA